MSRTTRRPRIVVISNEVREEKEARDLFYMRGYRWRHGYIDEKGLEEVIEQDLNLVPEVLPGRTRKRKHPAPKREAHCQKRRFENRTRAEINKLMSDPEYVTRPHERDERGELWFWD